MMYKYNDLTEHAIVLQNLELFSFHQHLLSERNKQTKLHFRDPLIHLFITSVRRPHNINYSISLHPFFYDYYNLLKIQGKRGRK